MLTQHHPQDYSTLVCMLRVLLLRQLVPGGLAVLLLLKCLVEGFPTCSHFKDG